MRFSRRASAEKVTIAGCLREGSTAKDSRIVVGWFYNQCTALTTSAEADPAKNTLSTGQSATCRVSKADALAHRKSVGGTRCKVAVAFHST